MLFNTFLREYKVTKTPGVVELHRNKVYFASQALDAGDGDVHQVLNVRAGNIVLAAWVDVQTVCPVGSTIDLGYGTVVNYWGNGLALDAVGKAPTIFSATATLKPYNLRDKNQETVSLRIAGVGFNDHVSVAPDGADVADVAFSGYVEETNYVAIRTTNLTGDYSLDLPTVSAHVVVNKAPLAGASVVFASADTIDIKATTDTDDVNINSGSLFVYALIVRV